MSQCEHGHPIELIDDCPRCGAPQCCRWCCEVQSLEQKLVETRVDNLLTQKTLEAQVADLREAAQAVVDTVNVHSLSRNSVTKASLVALAALLDKGEKDG